MAIPEQIWMDDASAFYHRAGWQFVFVVWPRRCSLSGDWIWFEHAYRGTAMWTGPGTPIIEHKWHERHEHLLWKLKGN